MVAIALKYVSGDVDRHGNVRYYVRRKGQPKVRLPGAPGTADFMAAYHAAIGGDASVARAKRAKLSSDALHMVCAAYYASHEFKRLDESTQAWQRRALGKVIEKAGHVSISKFESGHIRGFRDKFADKPAAANEILKALRALFGWAVEARLAKENPALGIKPIRYVTKGHHSWAPEEVVQFEAKHPIGSRARLAMALLLYTACRREDLVRLGPKNVVKGRLRYVQAKNEHRNPVAMDIPVHADLAEVIAASPTGIQTFLVTEYGRPFSVVGFGNKFREWCVQAGLPHCSAHGLRKAAAVRLAERGASPHEIMAITGHQTLSEVERYTKAAQRSRLANSAMERLEVR